MRYGGFQKIIHRSGILKEGMIAIFMLPVLLIVLVFLYYGTINPCSILKYETKKNALRKFAQHTRSDEEIISTTIVSLISTPFINAYVDQMSPGQCIESLGRVFLYDDISLGTNVTTQNLKIRTVQESLKTLGYNPGPIDGVMGPKTQDAIRQFQINNNFPETGVLDKETEKLLFIKR
jgi:hypothetical protein